MQTRELVIAFGGLLIAAGGAAMFQVAPALWPHHEWAIFLIAAALVVIGIGAFVWAMVTGRKKSEPKHTDQSVTSHGQSGGITSHTVNLGDGEKP